MGKKMDKSETEILSAFILELVLKTDDCMRGILWGPPTL